MSTCKGYGCELTIMDRHYVACTMEPYPYYSMRCQCPREDAGEGVERRKRFSFDPVQAVE